MARDALLRSLNRQDGARLGWVTWPDADALIYCDRRFDLKGDPAGLPGPCFRVEAGQEAPEALGEAASLGRPDETPIAKGPWERCSLASEASVRVGAPARLTVTSPSGRQVIAEWSPPPGSAADGYRIESSFDPEGRWMALLYLAVTAQPGGRSVHVVGAELRPVAACR